MKTCRLFGTVLLGILYSASLIAIEPDMSSPQAALRSLQKAVETQDGDTVLKLFFAANDEERDLAKTFANLMVTARKLGDAEKTAFGVTGDAPAPGLITADELSRLDQAEMKIAGDIATLMPVGRSRAIQFHHAGGQWQLVIRDFANAEENLPRQVSLLKKVTQVFEAVTAQIAAGDFSTSQEAEAVIQTKLAAVMIKAATQATSQPATRGKE